MAAVELDAAERRLIRDALAHHLPAAMFPELRAAADRIIGRTVIADIQDRAPTIKAGELRFDDRYTVTHEGAGWPAPRPAVGVTGEPPREQELEPTTRKDTTA